MSNCAASREVACRTSSRVEGVYSGRGFVSKAVRFPISYVIGMGLSTVTGL